MGLVVSNSTIEKYFGFLTKLDRESKKRIIVKLTESIGDEKEDFLDLRSFYGAWDDSRSSDEIINEIKASRVDKDDLIGF
jgi:hypothetical protein